MNRSPTFGRHVAWHVIKSVLMVFVLLFVLLVVFDFSQRTQLIGEGRPLSLETAVFMSVLRGPSLAEDVLPFAVLFGSMISFVQLNRRLEFTIARAAGVSAWQILRPALIVAALFGAFTVLVYNPAATAFREMSLELGGVESVNSDLFDGGSVWLRQGGNEGPSIIGASRTAEEGTLLSGVTAFQYAPDGTYTLRVDAPTARLVDNEWVFDSPVVTPVGEAPTEMAEFRIHTNLTLAQIRESLVDPDTVAVWRLPGMIEIAAATSLPADSLRLRFHSLLAMPVLLAAMVLIAAVVSLKFSRTLKLGRLIVTGAASGFVLYVVLVVSNDLGRGGILTPTVAAWAPALIAVLASVTVLLREEDG